MELVCKHKHDNGNCGINGFCKYQEHKEGNYEIAEQPYEVCMYEIVRTDILDHLRKKFIEIDESGVCPNEGHEPDDCCSDRCGLCILDKAITETRK